MRAAWPRSFRRSVRFGARGFSWCSCAPAFRRRAGFVAVVAGRRLGGLGGIGARRLGLDRVGPVGRGRPRRRPAHQLDFRGVHLRAVVPSALVFPRPRSQLADDADLLALHQVRQEVLERVRLGRAPAGDVVLLRLLVAVALGVDPPAFRRHREVDHRLPLLRRALHGFLAEPTGEDDVGRSALLRCARRRSSSIAESW